MTTTTVFSTTADARIRATSTTYANAREGSGDAAFNVSAAAVDEDVGQSLGGGSVYACFQLLVPFDTSAIADTDTISAAAVSLYGQLDSDTVGFTVEARLHDFGATIEAADFVAGSSLGSQTLLATFASSGFTTSGYNDFTDVALPANVNKTGETRILFASDRQRTGNAPTGNNEFLSFYLADQSGTTNDPKLVITHEAVVNATATPSVIATTASLPSATRTAGSTPTPATISTTTALPQASARAGSTKTPSVLTNVIALPTAIAAIGAVKTPAVIAAPITLPQATTSAASTPTPQVMGLIIGFYQPGVIGLVPSLSMTIRMGVPA